MTNELITPTPKWVDEVSGVQEKRRRARTRVVRLEPEFEIKFEASTATFAEMKRQCWHATPKLGEVLKSHLSDAEYRRFLSDVFDRLDDLGPELWERFCADARREFERTDRVTDLPVGPVTYELRRPLKSQIDPSENQCWEFSIEQFRPRFVGKGASIAVARRDFLNQVHVAFQSLVRRRPFQMDKAQLDDWHTLERLIDVDAYWACVPVALLEIGVLSAITDTGWEVVWLDGERKEIIPIERTLPEFAAFQTEQWFEALVERRPGSYELRKLRYVRPIEPIRKMSPDELQQWIGSLPCGDNVPKSETKWTDL